MFLSNDMIDLRSHVEGDFPRPEGCQLLIKVYAIPEQMDEGSLIIPEEVREDLIFKCIVGLVMAKGPDCYVGDRFKHWNKCAIKDWVVFPPNEGTFFYYRDCPMRFIHDDKVLCKVSHPGWVSRD